jgi:hypothetical protein
MMEGVEMVVKMVYERLRGHLGSELEKDYSCKCHPVAIVSEKQVDWRLNLFHYMTFSLQLDKELRDRALNTCKSVEVQYLLGLNSRQRTISEQISDLTILREFAERIKQNMAAEELSFGEGCVNIDNIDIYYKSGVWPIARLENIETYVRAYAKNLETIKEYTEELKKKWKEKMDKLSTNRKIKEEY